MELQLLESKPKTPFQAWRRNVHSQCGEDGIIEALLSQAGAVSNYFVEFGAWDGRHLSNCARLADEGWKGCFIEGDRARFRDLQRHYSTRPDIATINAFVDVVGPRRLDELLAAVGAPQELGVLSIDIDGMDYHVWKSVERFHPVLCVIEFNPTIPSHVVYIQEPSSEVHRGASLAALSRLSHERDYALVAATDWNAFFMPAKLCATHNIPVYSPDQVKDRAYEAALFHGYDGTLIVGGSRRLLWHGIDYGPFELQVLPPKLQRFPIGQSEDYSKGMQAFRANRSGKRLDSGPHEDPTSSCQHTW